jgi:hypothetical protein
MVLFCVAHSEIGGEGEDLFSFQPMEGSRCLAFIPFKFWGWEGLVAVSMGNIKCKLQCTTRRQQPRHVQITITGDAHIHVKENSESPAGPP